MPRRISDIIESFFTFLTAVYALRLVLLMAGQKESSWLEGFLVLTSPPTVWAESLFRPLLDPMPVTFWVGPLYFDAGAALVLLMLPVLHFFTAVSIDWVRYLWKRQYSKDLEVALQ